MPFKIDNSNQIVRNIKNLQNLEQDVAIRLWSYLDQPRFMDDLRDYATAALSAMQDLGRPIWQHVVTRVEKQLAIYSKMQGNDYDAFLGVVRSRNVTPGDIADVIRVFGAWVEAGAPKAGGDYYREVEKKEPALGHMLGDANTELHNEMFAEKKSKRKGPSSRTDAFSDTYRDRGPRQGKEMWKFSSPDSVRLSEQLKFYLEKENRQKVGKSFTYVNGGAPVLMSPEGKAGAGRLGKGPVGRSTVGRMERVFGLMDLDEKSEGADISGTTADQIYFLQFWARQFGRPLDPTLYLLPIATLVTPYHHSLLEVALTLSYNKIIKYVIGQYDTLISGSNLVALDLLSHLTNDKRNTRMLVYYSNPWTPAGSWIFSPERELIKWQRLANAGDPLLFSKCNHLKGGGGWPDQNDIEKLMF